MDESRRSCESVVSHYVWDMSLSDGAATSHIFASHIAHINKACDRDHWHYDKLAHVNSVHTLTHSHVYTLTCTHISCDMCPHSHVYTLSCVHTQICTHSQMYTPTCIDSNQRAIPSYQRRPSSPRKREENVRFPTNLHGVRRSARPTSRWAPKAHRMMGRTQWRHCERSFGTNVLVLGKEHDNFPLLSKPLKRTSTKVSL